MATKKVGGGTKNGRDSIGRRLGVKINHLQKTNCGSIIIRQVGQRYKCGLNTFMSRNYTIHALYDGIVKYTRKKNRVYVNVIK